MLCVAGDGAYAIVGLVVGIPIGLVLSNLLWSRVASSLGIVNHARSSRFSPWCSASPARSPW